MIPWIDAALAEVITTSHPFEYVLAGSHQEYLTYLLGSGKIDMIDARFTDREDDIRGLHLSRIVLAGDRYMNSPAYHLGYLGVISRDNVIVECGLAGNVRRYWE